MFENDRKLLRQQYHSVTVPQYSFIYLFIFNLFIVDKFISVTTRMAFRKQQGLSQTPGAVNKIAGCWYR